MNFPIPWQERLCRSLRGTRKERRNRSLRVSLLGTLFKQVKVRSLLGGTLLHGRRFKKTLLRWVKSQEKQGKFAKTFQKDLKFGGKLLKEKQNPFCRSGFPVILSSLSNFEFFLHLLF